MFRTHMQQRIDDGIKNFFARNRGRNGGEKLILQDRIQRWEMSGHANLLGVIEGWD